MSEQVGYPRVQGKCPACGGGTLFLGSNGYVTCSLIGCPDPCAPSDVLGVVFPPSRHADTSSAPDTPAARNRTGER
jgi:hypothetical protein